MPKIHQPREIKDNNMDNNHMTLTVANYRKTNTEYETNAI